MEDQEGYEYIDSGLFGRVPVPHSFEKEHLEFLVNIFPMTAFSVLNKILNGRGFHIVIESSPKEGT